MKCYVVYKANIGVRSGAAASANKTAFVLRGFTHGGKHFVPGFYIAFHRKNAVNELYAGHARILTPKYVSVNAFYKKKSRGA
jgi:hypothetical protein